MESIFVSIAAYRDPECEPTIRGLLDHAIYPGRIAFGVCWQSLPSDGEVCFEALGRPGQVRCLRPDARESRGPGWARRESHSLWQGEDYLLQIDSHMRAHRGWDVTLENLLKLCDSERPILSTYPAPYQPPNRLRCATPHLTAKGFDAKTRMPVLVGYEWTAGAPLRRAFASAGCLFASARLLEEVPYDPDLYFKSAEPGFSARAWTHGWDMFSPHLCILHHHYGRVGESRHWSDHPGWSELYERSLRRGRHLLGIEASADPLVTEGLDGRYSLGSRRTLAEYERFAGLDFRGQTVSEAARRGWLPDGRA